MAKVLGAVQSCYIPWKGYFDIIDRVDEFVLYDDVQYSKNTWRNRNQIKTARGLMWLTIPVKTAGRRTQIIKDVQVSRPGWNRKHWSSIQAHLAKAKYFDVYRDFLESLYMETTEKYLSQINYRFLTGLCGVLGISTPITWSMDYHLKETDRTERIIEMCKNAGATHYISGPAALEYMRTERFAQENIHLEFMDYNGYPEYKQLFPPFVHQVSIVDLLCHTGADAYLHIKRAQSIS